MQSKEVSSPRGLSGPGYLLWWTPLASAGCLVCVGDGAQSQSWWEREHLQWLLNVCEASDWCDFPCLHLDVVSGTHIDLEEEWVYLGHILLLSMRLGHTRLRSLLRWDMGEHKMPCTHFVPAILRFPKQLTFLFPPFGVLLWLLLTLLPGLYLVRVKQGERVYNVFQDQ